MSNTDTKFFSNEENHSLLDRFRETLCDAKYFDMLVGYFRASGFKRLYQSFEDIDKIRILIGLNLDRKTYDILEMNNEIDFLSHKKSLDTYESNLIDDIQNSNEDEEIIEESVKKFLTLLQSEYIGENGEKSKKLEVRAYPKKNLHAKVYIIRYRKRDFGAVITGSSNFSESGLVAQREFNVELKDTPDVKFALSKFDELWEESVPVSNEFVEKIKDKTWINDNISPYLLYLKLLYEYFEEDINTDKQVEIYLPKGFIELAYQKQAVSQANRILHTYNGVILADVVGLGKTFITAMLLQQLDGNKLILVPPVLKEYWEDSLRDFGVRGAKVMSVGIIDQLNNKDNSKYDYIVIDEAHRFRNDGTKTYSMLYG